MEFKEQKGAGTLPKGGDSKLNKNVEHVAGDGHVITHGEASGTVCLPHEKNPPLKEFCKGHRGGRITHNS